MYSTHKQMTLRVLHIGFNTSHTHMTVIPLTHYTCTLMRYTHIYTLYTNTSNYYVKNKKPLSCTKPH